MKYGVLQEYILGPLLFYYTLIIYVCVKDLGFHSVADDTDIFLIFS